MADKKISALTAATLPLAGTEVLPIVQSGSTVKVATDDLTVKNVRSNATTGLLQVAGPGTGATRVMTTPDANFTAARTDAAQTFTGTQTFAGQTVQQTNVIRAVKSVALSDNVATTLFTVTTTDESGSNDGGTYACRVFFLASFTGSGSGGAAAAIASKSQEVMFTVANAASGTVARSAVVTMHTTARADPGGFTDLTDPVVTLNGVSNYVTDVQVTSDGQGVVSAGQMTAIIELVYTNYNTPPAIS